MKKVLFVLGLAMCATFAMAQTNRVAVQMNQSNQVAFNPAVATAQQPVDYKGSIFTKDDDVTLGSFDFSTAATTGIMLATDVINGTAVTATNAHDREGNENRWNYISDSNAFNTSIYAENPDGAYGSRNFIWRYMGARNGITDDNGFMFVSLSEVNGNNHAIHCWFELPAVDRQGAQLVDVRWRQAYAKYYDQCFIDYKKNNNWYSVEVNVTGVDIDVNGATGYGARVATLPADALTEANIQLRFRIYASGAQNAYGYFWAVDNVEIVKIGTTARWSFNSQVFLNGFYGTLPQGFQIPLTYAINARNRGVENLTGITLSASGMVGDATTGTEFISQAQADMPYGDISHDYLIKFDESGYMIPDSGNIWSQAFPWRYTYYDVDDATLAAAGYQRRALPTAVTGKNRFALKLTNAQGLVRELDTIAYTVSENMEVNEAFGRTVPGYRWANDNGYVPGGTEFQYQFTTDPSNAAHNGYVTGNAEYGQNHQYSQGYYTYTRYNTPSVIPTDENGQPWVFRGIEYVTSTKLTSVAAGAQINPFIYKMMSSTPEDPTNSSNYNFYYIGTGLANDEVVVTTAASYAPDMEDNYGAFSPEMDQRVVNVLFPNQPAIEPNAMYAVGFENLIDQGYAVARTSYSYLVNADSAVSYANENGDVDPDFYVQFTPQGKCYDAIAYDPLQGSRGNSEYHSINGNNISEYPMIRLIVGPKMHIDSVSVYFDCGVAEDETPNDYWFAINTQSGLQPICGMTDLQPKGSSPNYYVIPGNPGEIRQVDQDNEYYIYGENSEYMPSRVITGIFVNGNSLGDIDDSTNNNIVNTYDYNVYWDGHYPGTGIAADSVWAPALERNIYMFSVRGLQAAANVTATTATRELSIGNAEENVNLTLSPNPATSQVRLNIAGIGGKINCSILDMSGRVVYSTEVNAGENVLNLNGIPAGAYFVRVTNSAISKVEKLVIR